MSIPSNTLPAMTFTGDQPETQQLISNTFAAILGQTWEAALGEVAEDRQSKYDLDEFELLHLEFTDANTEHKRTWLLNHVSDAGKLRQSQVKNDIDGPFLSDLSKQVSLHHIESGLGAYMVTLQAIKEISTDDLISHINKTAPIHATTQSEWDDLFLRLSSVHLPATQEMVLGCKEAVELQKQLDRTLRSEPLRNLLQDCRSETVISMLVPLATVYSAAGALNKVINQTERERETMQDGAARYPAEIQTHTMDMVTAIVGDALRWHARSLDQKYESLSGSEWMRGPESALAACRILTNDFSGSRGPADDA